MISGWVEKEELLHTVSQWSRILPFCPLISISFESSLLDQPIQKENTDGYLSVCLWGSLEVMLPGTSHHNPGLSHMLHPTTREVRKSKISVIENPLFYWSKLVFEYHASPKLQMWTSKWTQVWFKGKILCLGSAPNFVGMVISLVVISLVMLSSSSNHHQVGLCLSILWISVLIYNSMVLSFLPWLLSQLHRLFLVWRFYCFSIQEFQGLWVSVTLKSFEWQF